MPREAISPAEPVFLPLRLACKSSRSALRIGPNVKISSTPRRKSFWLNFVVVDDIKRLTFADGEDKLAIGCMLHMASNGRKRHHDPRIRPSIFGRR
ncbi:MULTISPECIES: hypothetical protein [Afifella]|uniref:hypothetical protein n=1 Tax=Afifella TaxID=643217 RepID=UPI000FE35D67|nr:hypothetical protein [Afifella aestuarii]